MQFHTALALFAATLVGVQAAPSALEPRFKVTGTATFCSAEGDGPFGGNKNGCADVTSKAGFTQLICVQAQTATSINVRVHNPHDLKQFEACPNVALVGSSCGGTDGSFAVITTITPPGQEAPKKC